MSTVPIDLQDEIANALVRPTACELDKIIYTLFLHLYGTGAGTYGIYTKVNKLIKQHKWEPRNYYLYLSTLSTNAEWWQYVLIERYRNEYSAF